METPHISATSFAFKALMHGRLEQLGLSSSSFAPSLVRLASIQEQLNPQISHPVALIFAGSHDFITLQYPNLLVTQENLFSNIINNEASVNKAAKNRCLVKLIDAGFQSDYRQYLNFWLRMEELMELPGHWNAAKDFTTNASLGTMTTKKAMKEGARLVDKFHQRNSNLVVLNGLGSASWFSSYTLMLSLGIPSLTINQMKNELSLRFGDAAPQAQRLIRKLNIPLKNHPRTSDPVTLIGLYGSTELAMITGAILKAASLKMAVILDGVTSILASQLSGLIHRNSLDYCFIVEDQTTSTSHLLESNPSVPILSTIKSGQQDGTDGIIALNSFTQYCDLCL